MAALIGVDGDGGAAAATTTTMGIPKGYLMEGKGFARVDERATGFEIGHERAFISSSAFQSTYAQNSNQFLGRTIQQVSDTVTVTL